jgi:hypothetical protein
VLGTRVTHAELVSVEKDGLQLTVEPRRSEIIIGEPLVLALRFANVLSDTLRICGPLEQQGHELNIGFGIRHESGIEYRPEPPVITEFFDMPVVLSLGPGEYVDVVYVVAASYVPAFDPRLERKLCEGERVCWNFPVPGSYDVGVGYSPAFAQFRTSVWQGSLAVSGIRVIVRAPLRPIDVRGLEVWEKAKRAISMWRDPSAAVLPQLAPFLDGTLGSSTYAPYARYLAALATNDVPTAESYLVRLVTEFPEFVLVDEALFDLAAAQELLGKVDETRQTKERAVRETQHSVRSRRYEPVPSRPH